MNTTLRKKLTIVVSALLSALVLSTLGAGPALAAYPDKNIELVVGYKPGGGYSDWAQAIAPFIEKHLPNKVNVLVRHMDGAANAVAASYIQKAKPDGYTIGIYNMSGLAAAQLGRKVQYDLSKVTWLARLSVDNDTALVSAKGPYKSMEDFKKQTKPQYIVSTKGLSDRSTITAAVTLKKLGVNWKPLNHNGTSETVLAVLRGDADVMWGTYESVQQYIDNGDLKALVFYGGKRNAKLSDVPVPAELGMGELNEAFNAQRLLGAPPKLPANIRTALEDAIKKAVDDPEFHEAMKKMKKSPDYLPGKQTEELVRTALKNYEAYAGIVKELLGGK